MDNYVMSADEFNEISFALEKHHTLFYKIWTLGKPIFNPRINTAQVGFDKLGRCILFEISPTFWKGLTFEQKLFVICHEAKHVINNHGIRAKGITDPVQRRLANIAMDLCVNHDLINRFDFTRQGVDPTNEFIWLDRVAEKLGVPSLPDEKTFEYYYELFKKSPPGVQQELASMAGTGNTVDDHDGMMGFSEEDIKDIMQEIAESGLSDDEKKKLADMNLGDPDPSKGRGFYAAGKIFSVDKTVVKKKKKWETIIKKWAVKMISLQNKERQQWVFKHRRMAMIDGGKMFLPSDRETDAMYNEKHKIKVWFFLDTSGSCIGLKDRFFRAAKSLPVERFDVKLLCFDTAVYPTTLESGQVFGGGGTALQCMENYILRNTIKAGEKYPDAVFVITDAEGGVLTTQYPEKWYWFLTTMRAISNIPKKSFKFSLKDFE